MARFNKQFLAYLVALVAAGIAFGLLGSNYSRDGFEVLDNIDQLTAPAAGQPALEVDTTCLPKSQVTDGIKSKVKELTGAEAKSCKISRGDSLTKDALWGIVAFAVAFGIFLWVRHLAKSSQSVALFLFAVCVIAALFLGAVMDDVVLGWFTDWGLIALLFAKGFGAAAFATFGYFVFDKVLSDNATP